MGRDTHAAAPYAGAPSATYDSADVDPARVLRLVVPDAELRAEVTASADRYRARLGLWVAVSADGEGVPVVVSDEVWYRGKPQDALAHYDRRCAWDECDAPDRGVYVEVSRGLLDGKRWALANTVDHEIAHVASGWGRAAGRMHVDGQGHMLSPGCRGGVCPERWTLDDAEIICAAAPCGRVNLD